MPSFKPPESFVPSTSPAESWRKWRQAFELYYTAEDLQSKTVPQQRAMLLVSLGEEGLEIFNTLNLPEDEETQTVQDILNALTEYFRPYRNVTYARHVFFTSVQGSMTIDQFVTDLKTKARDCEFRDISDSLIRDILICGVRETPLRERLLKEPNLTLPMAIDICRSDETSKTQTKLMTDPDRQEVHAFLKQKPVTKQNKLGIGSTGKYSSNKTDASKPTEKTKCGKCCQNHPWGSCPAYGRRCRRCGKPNHYAIACRGYTSQAGVHELETETENTEDTLFLGSLMVHGLESQKSEWFEQIRINNLDCQFKVDTGSHVNILPLHVWDQITEKPILRPCKRKVTSYTGHSLEITGECRLNCTNEKASKECTFLIVPTGAPPIIGLKSAE